MNRRNDAVLTLKRVEYGEAGCFGVLQWFGITFCVTLERSYAGPYLSHVTKIPPGVYKCVRDRFNKAREPYDTWKIVGGVITPDREIKFHIGNTEDDSEGCILVGEEFGRLSGARAVLASGRAFREFMTLTADFDELDFAVLNV